MITDIKTMIFKFAISKKIYRLNSDFISSNINRKNYINIFAYIKF